MRLVTNQHESSVITVKLLIIHSIFTDDNHNTISSIIETSIYPATWNFTSICSDIDDANNLPLGTFGNETSAQNGKNF